MKSLSVVTKSLYDKLDKDKKFMFPIDNKKIPVALVETEIPFFDANSEDYANTALVRKAGFSLNYRDLGIIEQSWNKLKDLDGDAYYPIGSDFCGYIEDFGSNVTGFSKGDLVIGDGSYPFGKNGSKPGVPSNHASKEYEIYHFGKLTKIDKDFPIELASGATIGSQTGNSMVEKAKIKKGDNVLVTSITSSTSLYLLNMLKDVDCNIYGMSYSGNNIDEMKAKFPHLKDVFLMKEKNIPQFLFFDAVLDPFSDTYMPYLIKHLNFDCNYLTCGVYNQSSLKMANVTKYNLSSLFAFMLMKNINFIGNCLGKPENLIDGLSAIKKNHNLLVDSVYSASDKVEDFMNKTYYSNDRLGKVVFKY